MIALRVVQSASSRPSFTVSAKCRTEKVIHISTGDPAPSPATPSPFSAAAATFLLNCLGGSKLDRCFGSLFERCAHPAGRPITTRRARRLKRGGRIVVSVLAACEEAAPPMSTAAPTEDPRRLVTPLTDEHRVKTDGECVGLTCYHAGTTLCGAYTRASPMRGWARSRRSHAE